MFLFSASKEKFFIINYCKLARIDVSFTRLVALPLAIFCIFYTLAKSQHKIKSSIAVVSIWMLCLIPAAFRTHQFIGSWSPFCYTIPNLIYMQSGKNIVSFSIQNEFGIHEASLYSPSVPHPGGLNTLPAWIRSREGNQHFIIDARKGDSDWNIAQKESKVSAGNFIWL